MAKLATLYDPFGGAALDGAIWTTSGSPSVAVSGGLLTLGPTGSVVSVATNWDLTDSSITIELDTNGEPTPFDLLVGSGGILAPILRWNGGQWNAGQSVFSYPSPSYSNFAAASGAKKFARMSESGGTVTFAHSDDGVSWTDFHTQSMSGLSSCGVSLTAGSSNTDIATIGAASAPTVARSIFPFFLG